MKNAKSDWNPRSTTWRKSQAQIAEAWLRTKVAHGWPRPGGRGGRAARMWRWTVRLPTRMPSLRSSPRMRSAPHSRFSAASRWISATVSVDTWGRCVVAADLAR